MGIPKPTQLRISTHTATCNINSNINVKLISEKLKIGNGIVYIEYGTNTKGINPKNISKKAKTKKKVFFNQITIIVEPKKGRLNNVKLFNNGAVSMTGLKAFEEGEISMNIILSYIKNIKGVILKELDSLENNSDESNDAGLKDSDLNKVNNFEKSNDICYSCDEYNNSLICNFCEKECSIYTLNKLKCNHNVCNLCKENITKCQKCNTDLEEYAVYDREVCKIKDYKIVLINSDFYVGFEIDRSKLHNLLYEKYQIFSTFEPCIYPGVNSKYFWNEDYANNEFKGKCYCDVYCNGKGKGKGNGGCKKITISMFQSGSVIITGARNMEQINVAYNFVNNIFTDNYECLKKNDLDIFSNETNKKKMIKIKKTNIINYPNQQDLLKLTCSQ